MSEEVIHLVMKVKVIQCLCLTKVQEIKIKAKDLVQELEEATQIWFRIVEAR